MATLKYEAVAVVGETKDGKKQYQKIGAVFESDKGLSLKIDCIPVGGTWNGWVSFYATKPKDGNPSRSSAVQTASQAAHLSATDPNDEIPF
jgi:hypothetical protein